MKTTILHGIRKYHSELVEITISSPRCHYAEYHNGKLHASGRFKTLRLPLVLDMYEERGLRDFDTAKVVAKAKSELARRHAAMLDHQTEPDLSDPNHYCPDCERPNQFGEICQDCLYDRQVNNDFSLP